MCWGTDVFPAPSAGATLQHMRHGHQMGLVCLSERRIDTAVVASERQLLSHRNNTQTTLWKGLLTKSTTLMSGE